MNILNQAFDEYVIRGVTHNIGFGKSILANKAYATGDYSTAFIPELYPKGFSGDDLNKDDHSLISVVGHQIKNHFNSDNMNDTLYIRVEGLRDAPAETYKVHKCCDVEYEVTDFDTDKKIDMSFYEVTNMSTGESAVHNVKNFNFEYSSLINLSMDGTDKYLQFNEKKNDDIGFNFYYKGNNVAVSIFEEKQYAYEKHMPEPVKFDFAKAVISPMPGAIVSVSVKPGDKVVDGQELIIIEAMKMQNIIKSEVDGEVESVTVKAGDSVAVDHVLITFK